MNSEICNHCCKYMNKSKYITCDNCRKIGKYYTSNDYGKMMGWNQCISCKKHLLDPNKPYLECNSCYYYKKRTENKRLRTLI